MKSRLAAFAAVPWLCASIASADLQTDFSTPPDAAKPWVYWYFMDGNSSRPGMTADLESMKKVGIGGAIFLEVNIGVPRGPVDFMSDEWQRNFVHAVHEADRLGLQIAVGTGPGWCGTGGPWVKPEQSMQVLVASATDVTGPLAFNRKLEPPKPREPFFGLGSLNDALRKQWASFYDDVAVLAFPTPPTIEPLKNVAEEAVFERAPFSSGRVKPFLPAPSVFAESSANAQIPIDGVIDLTSKLHPDGTLDWQVPAGNWTILRFGRTSTGQGTRPAPDPGLGFETDKFDRAALDDHFAAFSGKLINDVGARRAGRGLTGLHFDSWEMSAQNWSQHFRDEFKQLRGYDPLPYLPAMTGRTVGSPEITARFLWDLRQTTQELIYTNHVAHLHELSARNGLNFSSEPYDMNPAADLYVGSVVDIPMCEFWSKGYGFNTEYSCFEATSIGHVMGRPIIAAESFTADAPEAWKQYPGSMKAQSDWALATGINRIAFHRYQHQPEPTQAPGIAMGPYGVHWERTQTWWDMVPAYHTYLARASHLLQQGNTVADILYLAPEGAPCVFQPPASATSGPWLDRRGYNFDGIDPHVLIDRASVKNGRIVFEGGASYRVLVLPRMDTMTPALLGKIKQLLEAGATVVGAAPTTSPSLADRPAGDGQLAKLANELWGETSTRDSTEQGDRKVGLGLLVPDKLPAVAPGVSSAGAVSYELYPDYATAAALLARLGVKPDFEADLPMRYAHRHDGTTDLYFVANAEEKPIATQARFRVAGMQPEWWDPQTGTVRDLPAFEMRDGITEIPLTLDSLESGFVVFRHPIDATRGSGTNFETLKPLQPIVGTWQVAFDSKFGGPNAAVSFATLEDWSRNDDPRIRLYSGKAVYSITFDAAAVPDGRSYLSLGTVMNVASVKLNGTDLGVAWCAPWRVAIPRGTLKPAGNVLEVTVANLWINRLIGDSSKPQEQRVTFTTYNPYKSDSPLQPSGLLGPVELLTPVD